MSDKFWIFHAGSNSYFAAKDYLDAWEVVKEMNENSVEAGNYPLSRVEIVDKGNKDDIKEHDEELERRESEGDCFYFCP